MRRSLLGSPFCRRLMLPAAVLTVALTAVPAFAQQAQLPALKPPPPPPIRPYQPVAVTPPAPFNDASFVAFRKQLADIAAHKDRAALANLVVAQNFFWVQDKDLADKNKSGIDNLAKAIALDAKDGSGWDTVAGSASEPSAMEIPQQKGVFCAPADPAIDQNAFQALANATGTEPSGMGLSEQGRRRSACRRAAEFAGGRESSAWFWSACCRTAAPPNPISRRSCMSRRRPARPAISTPQTLAPLGGDQMCYTKDAGGWKIAGYFGGVSPQ